jgi:glucose/arabinose dehydrogenase
MKRSIVRVIPAIAASFAMIPAAIGASQAAPQGTPLLPDLDQEMPTQLVMTKSGKSWRLGFRSAVRNIGAGPLIIDGRRPSPGQTLMQAEQVVVNDGAPRSLVHGAGTLRYVRSPDHQHWHLLGFDRYELRRAGGGATVVSDRKTGFCLGDRYPVTTRELPTKPPEPVYTSRCGIDRPGLLGIREGISVGYGDDYTANLEGQYLPLDHLRPGRYLLVHEVNSDRRLLESAYDNNASSLLLRLRRGRGGAPRLKILAVCPTSEQCPAPAAAASTRGDGVETVATGLEIPWDIAFMPGGGALVTERPGRVRLFRRDGSLRRAPVARIPVSAIGEGGLLGVAIDPAFARNRYVYLYFTTAQGMRLERRRWTGSRLANPLSLIDGIRAGRVHDSGRIAFGPDRRLYISTGDAGEPALAQDTGSLNGKLLALTPAQYRGAVHAAPEVVARGLRNSQGFDWEPASGRIVATDHGPSGFDGPEGYDEVNAIVPGGNYGWPQAIGDDTGGGRYTAPLRVYRAAIAPSGATFVSRRGSRWTGDFLLAALRGTQLRRLELRDGRVVADRLLLSGRYGRLRTVVEGPDGCIYVLTSNRDGRGYPTATDDRILRVRPPGAPRCQRLSATTR